MTVTASPIRVTRQAGARVRVGAPYDARPVARSPRCPSPSSRWWPGLIAALATSERQGATLGSVAERRAAHGHGPGGRHVTVGRRHHRRRVVPPGSTGARRPRAPLRGGPGHRLGRRGWGRTGGRLRSGGSRQPAGHSRPTFPPYAGIIQEADFNERQAYVPACTGLPRRRGQDSPDPRSTARGSPRSTEPRSAARQDDQAAGGVACSRQYLFTMAVIEPLYLHARVGPAIAETRLLPPEME